MSDNDQPATTGSPSKNAAGALPEDAAGAINIEHLAGLAQLQLTPAERVAVSGDLARIIAMVDSMQRIDTSGIEPLAHPLDASQRLRADAVTEVVDRALNQRGAPATEDGFYLVPRVVE